MSKSLGNQIGVAEPPDEIYGKVMSISDDTMWSYWTLLTDLRPLEIEALKGDVASGALHPKALKMRLAARLVADFHGEEAARNAGDEFARRFAGAAGAVNAETVNLADRFDPAIASVLVAAGLAASKNIARQKIREGAVSLSDDGRSWTKVENPAEGVTFAPDGTRLVRLGKRFVRLARG
jgi:tyrosyl-tRNA synthetase